MIILLSVIRIFFSPHGGCQDEIVKQLAVAKHQIRVEAYAFTSTKIADALVAASVRGLDVRVIVDSSWKTASSKVVPLLIAAGIQVLSDAKHPIFHDKVIVIDSDRVFTGSYNFTGQAETNAENLVELSGADGRYAAALYVANWQLHAAHSLPP
jgi:phosphatidylserine/phosphatidylglycerophosphate/cardiolipin synthase-like enzyme